MLGQSLLLIPSRWLLAIGVLPEESWVLEYNRSSSSVPLHSAFTECTPTANSQLPTANCQLPTANRCAAFLGLTQFVGCTPIANRHQPAGHGPTHNGFPSTPSPSAFIGSTPKANSQLRTRSLVTAIEQPLVQSQRGRPVLREFAK